jgi:uncharacterized protein YjbI with pentapeptide repeats
VAAEREIEQQRSKTELEIAKDNQREAALQAYINEMSELLLHENLRKSMPEDEVRKIARVRTLTVLPRLDGKRKGSVLQFLHESGLIDVDRRIIILDGANLTGLMGEFEATLNKADLRNTNMSNSNLSGAKLLGANLSTTYIQNATFEYADLQDADLSKANLISSDLSNANLSGANLSGAYFCSFFFLFENRKAANLIKTNLSNAILIEADLTEVNLTGANLSRADLSVKLSKFVTSPARLQNWT